MLNYPELVKKLQEIDMWAVDRIKEANEMNASNKE